MSLQAASAVAITGGTSDNLAITTGSINGTPIGAVTPATGEFNTITAHDDVTIDDNDCLKLGTDGDYSQCFDSSTSQHVFSTTLDGSGMTDANPAWLFNFAVGGTADDEQKLGGFAANGVLKWDVDEDGDTEQSGEVTAAGFNSSAADGYHALNVMNTNGESFTETAGDTYWDNTTKNWYVYDGSAWRHMWTSGTSETLDFATTGTLTGGIMILDNVVSPTAAQVYGSLNTITTAGTVTLPAVAQGMSTCIEIDAAIEITLELDNSDTFILNGVTMAAGEAIINTTAEAADDWICVVGRDSTIWKVKGKKGTWTEATP
jgi:hypothetical protein